MALKELLLKRLSNVYFYSSIPLLSLTNLLDSLLIFEVYYLIAILRRYSIRLSYTILVPLISDTLFTLLRKRYILRNIVSRPEYLIVLPIVTILLL